MTDVKSLRKKIRTLNAELRQIQKENLNLRPVKVFELNMAKLLEQKTATRARIPKKYLNNESKLRLIEKMVDSALNNPWLTEHGREQILENQIGGLINLKGVDRQTALDIIDFFIEDIITTCMKEGLLDSNQIMQLLEDTNYDIPRLEKALRICYNRYKLGIIDASVFFDAVYYQLFALE